MRPPRDYERRERERERPPVPPELIEQVSRDGSLWQWRKPPPIVTPGQKAKRAPSIVSTTVRSSEHYELQRGIKALFWVVALEPLLQLAPWVFADTLSSSTGTLGEFFPNGLYQQGDIAVCLVQTANQAVSLNGSITNGWKEYLGPGGTTFPIGTGTAGVADASRLSIFWTRVTNKPATSDTHVEFADPGDHICTTLLIIRGAAEYGDPFDTASSSTGTTTSVTIPGVTTTVAGCLGIAVCTVGGPSVRTFASWDNGFTEFAGSGSTAGVDGSIGAAYKVLTSSGATGDVTLVHSSGTATRHADGLIAIKPEVGTTHNMPQHVGAGALQTSTTGSITYPIPAGIQDYDVILLRVQSANEAVVLTTAQGFVEVTNQGTGTANAAGSTRMTIFWRRVGAGEAGTIGDVVIQASADHLIAGMHFYRHCKRTGDPWDTFAGDVEATGSTSVTFPTVTTSVDDCLILCYGAHGVDTGTNQFGGLTNAALTYVFTRSASSTTNGVGGGQAVYSAWKYSAGATGTSTTTLSTSSKQARITIALLPEPETDWETDPTSGYGVPRTLGQWANVLDAALGAHTKLPTSVYTFQEPADDIRDAVSTAAAFANSGAGFTYLSSTTGWARSGLLFTEASANKLSATIPAADANSFLCLFYIAITATPGASARHVIHHPNLIAAVNTTPVYQAVDPSATNPTLTGTENPGTTVHPVWLRSNRTANTLTIITDQETINAVNFEDTLTTLILGSNSSVNAPMRVLYGARWTGAAAEMSDSDIEAINAELGWAVPIEGEATITLGALTLSADGDVVVKGDAALTLDALTASSAGVVITHGDAAITLDTLTAASTGVVITHGDATPTLEALTSSADGDVIVRGAATPSLDDATTAADGDVIVRAEAALTLDACTLSSTGVVVVRGAAAITLGDVTGAAHIGIAVHVDATLADLTSAAAGVVITHGAASITLDAIVTFAVGGVVVRGAGAATLDDATSSAAAGLVVDGELSRTLDDATAAGAGIVGIDGTAAIALEDVTSSAAVRVVVDGEAAIALGDLTLGALASLPAELTAEITLGGLAFSSTGQVLNRGALSATLDELALVTAGINAVTGRLFRTLEDLGTDLTGSVPAKGAAPIQLGAVQLSSQVTHTVHAAVAVTLAGIGLIARGEVRTGILTAAITLADLGTFIRGVVRSDEDESTSVDVEVRRTLLSMRVSTDDAIDVSPRPDSPESSAVLVRRR